MSAQIPEGWSVDVNPNDGTLTLKEHPTNPDSPVILLGVTQSNLSSSINSTNPSGLDKANVGQPILTHS